jgi:hypothetical protein
MHKSQTLFYLTTALHVSGVTITHPQEHKTTVTTASGNHYTLLLSAAIVEVLEPVWVCCGWRTTHSSTYVTQFIYIWKLLYTFRVVLSPIIRSAYNRIYSIWYLSHRYCYLPLSWKSWNWFEFTVGGVRHPQHTQTGCNSSTIAADNSTV